MTPLILVVLSILDAAAAGFRDAAGRNALLDKSGYYRRSAVRGVACGGVSLALLAAVVLGLLATSADAAALWVDFVRAGEAMLWVYGSVAPLVLVALGIYLSPRFEIRALATVVILGPFTLLRPVVIVGGAVSAVVCVPRWEVAAGCIALIVLMVPLGEYMRWLGVNRMSLERMIEIR